MAETLLDIPFLTKLYKAKHKGVAIKSVETGCAPNKIVEPSRDCQWDIACSNFIHHI